MTTSRIQHFRAMIFMILASLCVSINLLLGKVVLDSLSVPWVVLFRFALPLFMLIWVGLVLGFPKLPSKASIRPLLIRCICFFLTQYFIFWYLEHGNYVVATVLTCCAPMFIPIVDKVFYQLPMSLKMWLSAAVSFIGVLLILKPGSHDWNNWVLLGLLSGFFSALSQISFNQVSKSENAQNSSFYLFFLGTILSSIIVLINSNTNDYEKVFELFKDRSVDRILFAFGLVTVLAQVFRLKAYSLVNKTGSVAPLSYFAILFSTVFAYLFYDQVLGLWSSIGVVLVILGGMILLHRKVEKRNL